MPRAPIVVFIVERAKKCLDFCFTIFLIHFCTCCFFNVQGIAGRFEV